MEEACRELVKGLRAVPPAADTPVMIDAFLSISHVSQSVLFHHLLSVLKKESEELTTNEQLFETFKLALLHFLKSSESTVDDLDEMVQVVCLPLLVINCAKVSKLIAEAVAAKFSWDYALSSLIPPCLAAITSALNCESQEYPPEVAFQIATELLVVAGDANAQKFCENILGRFWNPFLNILPVLDDPIRNSGMQTLLPSLLKAQAARESRDLNDVWNCCKRLLSSGHSQRLDAYRIFVILLDYTDEADLQLREPWLWEELRTGLVDDDTLTRKRALYVLKRIVTPMETSQPQTTSINSKTNSTKRERYAQQEAKSLGVDQCMQPKDGWSSFIFLYEMLHEYGIHLVEAAWKTEITALMKNVFTESGEIWENPNFTWMSLLFNRGFKHGNPQVRKYVVQSFFEMEWENRKCLPKYIPQEFVCGPLLHALNDPVHHKDFGLHDNIYSSETGKAARQFFGVYASLLDLKKRVCFESSLARGLTGETPCRAGLMTLASCIESAAYGSKDCSTEYDMESEVSHLLDSLRVIIEYSRNHFNPCYRSQVCGHVIKAVSSLVPSAELPYDKLSYFLASFPRESLAINGPLYSDFKCWVTASSKAEENMFNGLQNELREFLKAPSFTYTFVEGDIQSWREQAERWTRIMHICIRNEQHQWELLQFLEQHAVQIYNRVYMPVTVPEKILLLLQSLIKEYPPSQERFLLRTPLINLFHTIIGELVSYTEKSSAALWEFELNGPVNLPPSLTGRLGGLSERWLPPQACSAVIKAVLAVETVCKCYIWLCENNENVNQESVGASLWRLSLKLLTVCSVQDEVHEEFQLACFEALSYVSSALHHTNFSRIRSSEGFTSLEGFTSDNIVDTLINRLLKLFDIIVGEWKLTRSRRAVLTRHKWSCLDGLLSLGKVYAISSSTLSVILEDAIESLGSAAEDYMIPLFRCIRWIIDLDVINTQDNPNQVVWELVRAGWSCMVDCNKRKVANIAAFLSSFFHPRIFHMLDMHTVEEYDNEGPLKWLLRRLIDLGARSPRTMRLTALHVTGLWLKFPETTVFYMPEIKSICLYGGEAIDEEFDGEIFDNETAAREFSSLIQIQDPELQEGFANTDMFVRVSVAVMLDKLAEMVEKGPTTIYELTSSVLAAANCGRILLLYLLQAAANDAELSKELYKKNSGIHRRKVRVWQTLCILSRFIEEAALGEITKLLEQCLYMNNMPSVRQYIEVFAVQVYLRFPFLVKEHLVPLLSDFNMKPQALSSYVYIATNVIKFINTSLQEKAVQDILPVLLPHMTSHHHNLRTFTQVLLYHIFNMKPSISENLGSACLLSLSSYLEENTDCRRLRASVDQFLFKLEPSAASTPRGLFCSGTNDTKITEERPFECVPITVIEKVTEILNEAREELRETMAAEAIYLSYTNNNNDQQNHINLHTDYQKKISPYKDQPTIVKQMEIEDELLFSMIEKKAREFARAYKGRQELIVVASLIERVPNLAGLARTCEVFKASGLTLSDKNVLEDRQFKLISVTAEQWVPILEVTELGLNHFLELKKTEGYTIVGLEQTANSVPINKYPFPSKVVLVLGREKDGIPVNIINTLDTCVEIPQLGVIRSLNVHVSGAIAIWEYTKQHLSN